MVKSPGLCYFSGVSRIDLLTIGEAFEDLIFTGLPRLPRPGEEIKTSNFVHTVGGGAIITAVAAARLGLRCRVVSGLSLSALALLRAQKISVTNLRRPNEPYAITAALSTKTNRSFVTFNGVNDVLEERLFEPLQAAAARHVHFAFYPHDCGRWEAVLAQLRAQGVTTSWDFGWNEALLKDRGFASLTAALDYVFLNEQECRLYARRPSRPAAVAYWKKHSRRVVIKLGSKGSAWISASQDLRVPAPRVRVMDTTGAGDAFNGGFLYAVLNQLPPRTCLRMGNWVGAMSTRATGGIDALPRQDELA